MIISATDSPLQKMLSVAIQNNETADKLHISYPIHGARESQ